MLISNLSLLIEENGLNVVARAERVIAVVHQLVGRGVNAMAAGKDLHTIFIQLAIFYESKTLSVFPALRMKSLGRV